MSSPIVMMCDTSLSSRCIGILVMRYVARLAERARLDRELLHLARLEHALELAAQHLGRLTMQDLEDRSADRFLARHALEPDLALPIPGLDAVRAVDHVDARRAASR